MKKFIEINGKQFEMKKVKGELTPITSYRYLDDCYGKCSSAKVAIYASWLDWKINANNDPYTFGSFNISSFNFCMFTLECNVYEPYNGSFLGILYISKTRQEFWTI